jgi:hypothetical protein
MRYVTASIILLTLLSTQAHAGQTLIDQAAWLNYAVIVSTRDTTSNIGIAQHGTINGISSVQLAGDNDAQIRSDQKGRRNMAVIHQSGWNVISGVSQAGPNGFSGYTNLPTTYWSKDVDDGYLSYFMTGGFSLVTLTDANHTWFSRFGRAR